MNAEDRTRARELMRMVSRPGGYRRMELDSIAAALGGYAHGYEIALQDVEEENRKLRKALERISSHAPEYPSKGFSYMIDEYDITAVREALDKGAS